MDIRKLQRAIVDGLEDVKGQNIVVFNTEHLSPLFERVIIASGTSNRQTKSLASSVRETVKDRGMQVHRMEGEENGEWIIVDCGAAVVHVMQPAIRDYYHLEELWGDKPVKIKLGDSTTRLVKASEEDDEGVKKSPTKNVAVKKITAKKAAAKSAEKSPAAKTARAAATKTPVKTVAKKGAVTREVGMKTPATQVFKVGTAKPSVKKADVKKAVAARKPATASKPARKTTPRV